MKFKRLAAAVMAATMCGSLLWVVAMLKRMTQQQARKNHSYNQGMGLCRRSGR